MRRPTALLLFPFQRHIGMLSLDFSEFTPRQGLSIWRATDVSSLAATTLTPRDALMFNRPVLAAPLQFPNMAGPQAPISEANNWIRTSTQHGQTALHMVTATRTNLIQGR